MYEIRQKQRKELMQKKWFSYALLAMAIFLFSQGSSIIKTHFGYSVSAILLSFILHTRSVGDLAERILKIKSSIVANIAMLVTLTTISAICYFSKLGFLIIVMLNLGAILVYIIVAAICSKFNIGEN